MRGFPFSGYGDYIDRLLEERKMRADVSSNGCIHDWHVDIELESGTYYKCSKCSAEKKEI